MRNTLGMALLSGIVTFSMALPAAAGGLNIGGSNGISVDVNTSDGLGVDASVGGRNGVNANANVGGSRGVADVDASLGGSRDVNASANVNGSRGLSADVDASVGGERGLNASVGAQIGGSRTGIDIDVGLGRNPGCRERIRLGRIGGRWDLPLRSARHSVTYRRPIASGY